MITQHTPDLIRSSRGRWYNPGYHAQWHHNELRYIQLGPWRVPWGVMCVDEITLCEPPLTLGIILPEHDHPTLYVQSDRHFFSDYGSIPKVLQWVPGYDRHQYPYAYLQHDSAYQHQQVYVSSRLDADTYTPCPVTREMADALLCAGLRASDAPERRVAVIWGAVRAFGPRW